MPFDPPILRDAYDLIVVGSGSGGAAVTRRLVDAGREVLLIEAGGDGRGDVGLTDPTRWMQIAGGPRDWGHAYAPSAALGGRSIPIPRGRVMGGSGQTNAMMWYRGHPGDYDRWEALGCEGWGWADCLPYFRRAEAWGGPPSETRGTDGPLKIGPPSDPHPLALALIAAAGEAGMPVLDDPNGATCEGAALANLNIHAGRRFGPADGYLAPVLDAPGLTVALGGRVTTLIWDGDRASGLRLARGGETREIAARHGVVLAAGAFETPRLLMLSGAGPEAQLTALGIPVHLPLADLGENLQDHPLVRAVNFRARRPLPPPRDNGGGAVLNWRSEGAPRPDLHAFPVAARSATPELAETLPAEGAFAVATGLMRPRSRGRMRLTGPEPDAPLHLDPAFLADPSDRARLSEAIATILDLARQPSLAALTDGPLAPAPGDDPGAFLTRACATFFHPCGTARMGGDDGAVCDPRLALRGARGLWIADASVIPEIPSCHTHSTATLIGERAADFILEAT